MSLQSFILIYNFVGDSKMQIIEISHWSADGHLKANYNISRMYNGNDNNNYNHNNNNPS